MGFSTPAPRIANVIIFAGLVFFFAFSAAAQTAFKTNVRVGYQGGDNWEPGILADRSGHLYVVIYQEPDSPLSCSGCLNHLLIQRSDDGGNTWTVPVMPDPTPAKQQDTTYRSSADGGTTWSHESEVSNYVPAYSYLASTGYQFPYGDQFRMTIDSGGKIYTVWGEAPSYNAIGNSWVANQQ